jgi:hypothetical protein
VIAPPPQLTQEQMDTLAAIADILVPPTAPWPSASEAGVLEQWVDRALSALPGHAEMLTSILDAAAGEDPASEIHRLGREDPASLNALLLVVVGAYYLSPKVRRILGYSGPRRTPALEEEADYYLEGGLLDPVVARGSIYRPTPGYSSSDSAARAT